MSSGATVDDTAYCGYHRDTARSQHAHAAGAATSPAAARAAEIPAADRNAGPAPEAAYVLANFGNSAAFALNSLSGSIRRMQLKRSFDTLGMKASAVETDEVLRLKLTDWCSVLLDIRKARELDAEEAEALGSALTAALLDRVVVIKKL